jgi:quercetin dioxygenase-like cupin family protein
MAEAALPPDDASRSLTIARPETDESLPHYAVAGGVYTVLVSGQQTGGRYCLVDMLVMPGAGPGLHRHDFEKMFTILEGEVVFTFRDTKAAGRAGETVNVPANAPHAFRNESDKPARLLCMCAPAGQDELFTEIGDPVPTRTGPMPMLSDEEKAARRARVKELAVKYRTEMLG